MRLSEFKNVGITAATIKRMVEAGDPAPEAVLEVFKEVLAQRQADGVLFDTVAVRVSRIRQENEYGGLRIRATADIGGARIAVNVDVGFGDAIEPAAEWLNYPVLLDMPAPRLRGYARETVVAEKFQAMVALGMANSRMKDYYDLWILSQAVDIDRSRLAKAVSATFDRRRTAIPDAVPDGLSPAFAEDAVKRKQRESLTSADLGVDPGPLDSVVGSAQSLSDTGCGGRPRRGWAGRWINDEDTSTQARKLPQRRRR